MPQLNCHTYLVLLLNELCAILKALHRAPAACPKVLAWRCHRMRMRGEGLALAGFCVTCVHACSTAVRQYC